MNAPRVYIILCVLLLSTSVNNLVHWRQETLDLQVVERPKPVDVLPGKMPSLSHVERNIARLEVYSTLLEDQNRVFRDEVVRRFGQPRLAQAQYEAHSSTESFSAALFGEKTGQRSHDRAPGAPGASLK